MDYNLGNNIRNTRVKQKLTQEKLAELSGLSLNFISRLERTNTNNISVKNVIKIADALGVPVIQLIAGKGVKDDGYSSSKRLAYLLQNLPEALAESYANEFINILRIQNNKTIDKSRE